MNYTERKCKMALVCRSCNDATEIFAFLGGSKGSGGPRTWGEEVLRLAESAIGRASNPLWGTGNSLL